MSLASTGASAAYTRLMAEVERSIRIVSTLIDVIEGEIAYAQKQPPPVSIPLGTLKQLKELTSCLNSLTDAKIRLDKSAKALTDAMTPEEERAAVAAYLRAMTAAELQKFLASV